MNDILQKTKAATIAAGDKTARTARQTKLKGEIMMHQQKVTSIKKEFGVAVFDAMAGANRPEVERLFNETRSVRARAITRSPRPPLPHNLFESRHSARQRVEALENDIATKRATIEHLKSPSTPREGIPSGVPVAPGAFPPPPGPPPSGDSGLPPGWQKTATAEGREYFYHTDSGESALPGLDPGTSG